MAECSASLALVVGILIYMYVLISAILKVVTVNNYQYVPWSLLVLLMLLGFDMVVLTVSQLGVLL